MRSACEVACLTRGDPGFYQLMGPYLASRAVFRDLGEQPWDDPGKTWWLALRDGAVAGFAGALEAGAYLVWCSAYVVPQQRGQGLWTVLAAERDKASSGREVRVLCRPVLERAYLRMGFTAAGKSARYIRMRRP